MNSNKAENYSIGMNIREDEIYLDIKDEELNVFEGEECEFEVDFVNKNTISVEIPENIDAVVVLLKTLYTKLKEEFTVKSENSELLVKS